MLPLAVNELGSHLGATATAHIRIKFRPQDSGRKHQVVGQREAHVGSATPAIGILGYSQSFQIGCFIGAHEAKYHPLRDFVIGTNNTVYERPIKITRWQVVIQPTVFSINPKVPIWRWRRSCCICGRHNENHTIFGKSFSNILCVRKFEAGWFHPVRANIQTVQNDMGDRRRDIG